MNQPQVRDDCADTPEHQKSLTLPADDSAPRMARSFTRDALSAWGLEDLLDNAVLIVSELTTNAERYGRASQAPESDRPKGQDERDEEITLTLLVQADVVTIEVEDNSPHVPVERAADEDAINGRGLHLVSAMADSWTTCPTEDGTGKRVFAFIKRPEPTPAT
ncbi:anti-sigma regulatory factor (Ser/Thr protein kinase) [Streptomyces sp. TLI_55]|uniref:ATP-binding protein n=1 Tax=Streptomyces sp. TLI_55 TaxID=1938861 RepID=UPI000BD28D6D|nr:ATP-binding protein [Streptomyces sp. TLI_55]SNX88527.1 anti-sigma regulatory factor (Ser/Thr protein kinase) [Streptomyces sp. TLI_55]